MQQQTPAVFNFNGTDVRTALDADENVLFNVNDLCALLEYGNPRQALATHVQEDDVHQMDTIDNMGRNQVGNFVTEFGAYDLILGSRNKNAKEFKRWVTHEVLPSIRKTSTYTMTRAEFKALREDVIAGPKTLRLEKEIATLKLKQTKAEAKPEIARLKQKVERLEARVEHLFKGGCKVKAQFDNLCKGRMAYLDFNYLTEDEFGNPLPMIF